MGQYGHCWKSVFAEIIQRQGMIPALACLYWGKIWKWNLKSIFFHIISRVGLTGWRYTTWYSSFVIVQSLKQLTVINKKWNSSLSLNLEIGQATYIRFVIIINSMARGKSSTAQEIIIQNEILWQAPILSMIGLHRLCQNMETKSNE